MSKAAAKAKAASRVGAARPPRRPPAAVERISTPSSRGSCSMRARSPSSEPPLRFEDGSTASTATVLSLARQRDTSADSREDLPAPGGPVTPTRWERSAPAPAPAPATAPSSAAAPSRPRGERSSIKLRAAGAAARSPAASRRPSSSGSGCAGGGANACPLRDELDDVTHDLRQLEVLRRVDARDARLQQRTLVGRGDDPAHDHRHVGPGGAQLLEHTRDQLAVRTREDR